MDKRATLAGGVVAALAKLAKKTGVRSANTSFGNFEQLKKFKNDRLVDLTPVHGNTRWAVTPGQSAVLYDGDVCLGGGIIDGRTAI